MTAIYKLWVVEALNWQGQSWVAVFDNIRAARAYEAEVKATGQYMVHVWLL